MRQMGCVVIADRSEGLWVFVLCRGGFDVFLMRSWLQATTVASEQEKGFTQS